MQINIIEMFSPESLSLHPSGEHAWIEIEFFSGRRVTLRLDEFDTLGLYRPHLYAAVDDGIGTDVVLNVSEKS